MKGLQTSFIRHVFATLTYDRNVTPVPLLHFNRYIQQLRRVFRINIQYFRSFELQRDGTPHFHVLLQFPSACLRINKARYFDARCYRLFKGVWKYGLTDYQPPRSKATAQLAYIMKYLSKNASVKTVWMKIFASQKNLSLNVKSADSGIDACSLKAHSASTEYVNPVYHLISKSSKIKLLTWSRSFDFSPFYRKTATIALSNLDSLH